MRDKIFISYSHKDKRHKDRLETHLKAYSMDKQIEYWSDTDIIPGDNWEKEIKKAVDQAAVAILLLSADFMSSDYIRDKELPLLMEANKKDGVLVISVYLNYCSVSDEIKQFQYVNPEDRPLAVIPKQNREQVWARLASCAVSSLVEYEKASLVHKKGSGIHKAVIAGLFITFLPFLGPLWGLLGVGGAAVTITSLFADLFAYNGSEKKEIDTVNNDMKP